ncbi:PREDICTED: ankyrin repeat and SOCS box protein 5-like [Merops nubicus]|uniref:ankyrin repeat and SOCS box protein 5-like n=1 Tax=Merops nubicus TaxID=57421 RepID=UPI0004F036F8|nr:PREDICTED: ankyrin repeat and SOCS box protein 5-like [Merops nubicus]
MMSADTGDQSFVEIILKEYWKLDLAYGPSAPADERASGQKESNRKQKQGVFLVSSYLRLMITSDRAVTSPPNIHGRGSKMQWLGLQVVLVHCDGQSQPSTRSWADRSPLHEAASQGRLLSLKTLLSQGYNVDTLTIDQVTPLHEACLGDHVGCARILLEAGANVNATTIDGVTPLFNACSRGSAACAELLLEYGAKAQWESCLPSPTHEAASRGHSECLEVLISWGVDVDQDLPHLGTPLYVACVSQQIHCIRKLLYAGANVQKGKHLETPLHAAAQHSSTEIVNLLLEFGADINAKNIDFERPVDLAAPSSLVERLLLLHEATPSSLCQLCRLRIRNYIGRARLHLVPQLQLPTILKNFLQYR